MDKTMHTPGPWEVRKTASGNPFIYSGKINVAGVAMARHGIDVATSEANARLIAAAPELLAALIELRDAAYNAYADSSCNEAFALADAVISKATTA